MRVSRMKVFYSADYVASATAFDTTRKSEWIASSLNADPVEGLEVVAPQPLTFDSITSVHAIDYVKAVQTGDPRDLATTSGLSWDPGVWPMVTSSNGGVVAAARAALADGVAGSLSSGLHHARADSGMGFCTFNGLAIAAKHVLAEGAKSVLILDLDAHCGGGTHSLINDDARIRQADVSVDHVDHYEPHGTNTLDVVSKSDEYLSTIEHRLAELDQSGWKADLCLYNAGMDPDQRCSIGGLRGVTSEMLRERERLVFQWATRNSIPIAFVLAGGYSGSALAKDDLVALHRMTIAAAADSRDAAR